MNDTLCFIINDTELYLDKVLLAFNNIPVFYVCKDNNSNRYLVLCTDTDNFNYIVIHINITALYDMLTNKTDMRTPFLKAESFWKITTGDTFKNDKTELLKQEHLDISFLPIEGGMYNPISEEDYDYTEKIQLEYLSKCKFEEKIHLNLNVKNNNISNEVFSLSDLGANVWNFTKKFETDKNILNYQNNFNLSSGKFTKVNFKPNCKTLFSINVA